MDCVHTVVEDGITYKLFIEQDDSSVRGNALASGDDAEDKACEDEILERLENGDTWAWANVNVEASVEIDGETFRGDEWLGACSYANTADFVQPVKPGEGSYWEDMKTTSRDALISTLEGMDKRADAVRAFLASRKN